MEEAEDCSILIKRLQMHVKWNNQLMSHTKNSPFDVNAILSLNTQSEKRMLSLFSRERRKEDRESGRWLCCLELVASGIVEMKSSQEECRKRNVFNCTPKAEVMKGGENTKAKGGAASSLLPLPTPPSVNSSFLGPCQMLTCQPKKSPIE